MTHLFLFTIGPVQNFIKQARKTRDLKAGSQLLSDLIRHAWETAQKVAGPGNISPIVPDFGGRGLPNRFLAEVSFSNEAQARQLGAETEQAVREKLLDISISTLDKKAKEEQGDFRKRFIQQINDHLEIHWVISELSDDYKASYLETESLLGAVKATRTFEQLPKDEANRKCSVTGERDALVFPDIDKKRPSFAIKEGWAKVKGDEIQMAEGEGLSAIAFTKRFYGKAESFPSTAEIAILKWLEFAKKHAPNELTAFELCFKLSVESDGQLFFEENHNEHYLKKQGYGSKANNTEEMGRKIKAITQKLPKEVKKTPYYALLAFDGDKMGTWWSGENVPAAEDLKAFQKKLAKLFSEYAKWATDYLDQNGGKTVYAGGDDFLGFVNLQDLFPVLEELRSEFKKQVSDQTGVDQELTFSAGLAIAHYKTPLNVVLDTARMMEHKAKEDGRNRLGIKVLKHSGEAESAVLTWKEIPKLKLVIDHLQQYVSNKFVGDLAQEIMQLSGTSYILGEGARKINPDMLKAEINRIIKKRKTTNEYDSTLQMDLNQTAIELFGERSKTPRTFIDLLSIAMFIKRTAFIEPTPQNQQI